MQDTVLIIGLMCCDIRPGNRQHTSVLTVERRPAMAQLVKEKEGYKQKRRQ